jgi:hypothetical protein
MIGQCQRSLHSPDDDEDESLELPELLGLEQWGAQLLMPPTSLLHQRLIRLKEMLLLLLLLRGLVGIWIGCWVRIRLRGPSGRSECNERSASGESVASVLESRAKGLKEVKMTDWSHVWVLEVDSKYNTVFVDLDIFLLYMHSCIILLPFLIFHI